jgi:predicted AlkP superfamily phosphohydrolase/phosphomutase
MTDRPVTTGQNPVAASGGSGSGLRPLLVLGLDGATFELIRPLAAAGRLPNLAALMGEGSAAPLPSTLPPMTFPAWSSFLTGLEPGHHGVFDFTQKVPGRWGIRFTNAGDRTGDSLFARVCGAGGRVLALGMPATFPPEPVDGLLVCGFDAPVSTGTDARSASDPALYREIASRVGPWMRPDLDEGAQADAWHERALDTLLDRVDRKTAFALTALDRLREAGRPPDLVCVVFSESDTVAHHYWRDHDPRSPRHDPGASATRRGAIAAVYERLDAACGELRRAVGEEVPCVVVSDHGFGGAARRVVHLNRRLEECGLLRRAPAPRGLALDALARHGRDAALRLLPPKLAQAAFRRARPAAARLESAARFGGFDWAATAAVSEEANTQPGVWIALAGREARGSVARADYERVRREVIDALLDWKLPVGLPGGAGGSSGGPVVARALPREEVYSGPFVERAPDVVVELALEQGYGLSLVPTAWSQGSAASVHTLEEAELAGGRGRGMNGTHRPEGVFISSRVDLAPRGIAEVAPTLLHAMGIAWSAPSNPEHPSGDRREYTPAEQQAVAARLRALGYLE